MERNRWMDGVKFALIILVILGHCKHFTDYDNSLLSTRIISRAVHSVYFFHMPLFILISGYFSKRSEKLKSFHSTMRLLRIFFFFHLLWIGIELIYGRPFQIINFVNPSFTFWYLLCLAYWRIIMQLIPPKYDKCYIILPIATFISLLGGLLPLTTELSIPRTLTYMPLFFLGYYAKTNNWLRKIMELNFLWFLIPAIFLLYFENHISLDIFGRKPYHEYMDVIKRVVFLGSSIIISIAFLKALPQKITLFADEGKDVLFYYVYHSFVLFIIAELLKCAGIVVEGFGLLIIVITTLGILFVMKRIKWLNIPLR